MTAITPAYAHAYQEICLTTHVPTNPHLNFRLPKKGWAIFSDGGTRVVDGEILAGWAVIARSHHGRIDIMFGPVVTAEAHIAFSGARTHSNNTAEMTAMIKALSFLGPPGPIARETSSCIYYDSHAALYQSTMKKGIWLKKRRR